MVCAVGCSKKSTVPGTNVSESLNESVLYGDLRDVGLSSMMTKLGDTEQVIVALQVAFSSSERQESWRKLSLLFSALKF